MDDHYETLQVSQRAEHEVIKAAYHRLAIKYHPDRNPGNASIEMIMKRLNDAWEVLGDPVSRGVYDKFRKEAGSQVARELEATSEKTRSDVSKLPPHTSGPLPGNTSETPGQSWPPSWVEPIALLTASGGGLTVFVSFFSLLGAVARSYGDLGLNAERFSRDVTDSGAITIVIVAGLMLAEGIGLNCGKPWSIHVPLTLCLVATFGLGIGLMTNMIGATPIATIPLALLLVFDSFFVSVLRAWNKYRSSL